jgi:transcriptional regulator with XRE-family HTH domain
VPRPSREQPSQLGPRLREVRDATGDTLRRVEKRSGLTNGYLSQLERGEVGHPAPTVLRKVAKGYNVAFPVLLQWAGYIEDDQLNLSPNQAVALSTIGDPSTEDLKVLKEIVELLRRKGTVSYSPFYASSDLILEEEAKREIDAYARALLLEADAFNRRPTPLNDLVEAAELVKAGEITLTPRERQSIWRRLGHRAERGWNSLLGTLDFRSRTIWVKPDLHPKRERFVTSHEIGHAILPAHQELFGFVEDWSTVNPRVRAMLEREANEAAVDLLFQCGGLIEEADSSPIAMSRICAHANDFGASIVATSRHVGETSRRDVAIAIAHERRSGGLGPTHLYTSHSFEERYRWRAGRAPIELIRNELQAATSMSIIKERSCLDADDRMTPLRFESLHTGWAAIVLVARDSVMRRGVRKAVQGASLN